MTEQVSDFACGKLTLEGIWHIPDGNGPFPAVIVCHPHPLHGGDMHSSVVVAVSEALTRRGIIAFRFNFRGVGGSQGSYGDGLGEQEDIRAAITLVASDSRAAPGKTGLAGYSFGAGVALPVAAGEGRVEAVAAISPPPRALESLKDYPGPKLILVGSRDQLMPPEALERLAEGLPQPTRFEITAGPDHFWGGYEGQVGQTVADFFAGALR